MASKGKDLYVLTAEDIEIFRRAKEHGSWFTSFYVRPIGRERGWEFDHLIDPPYQEDVHHANQTDIVIIGGMGSSKTSTIAMSGLTWATTTPDFAFLNTAPVGWQSKQMYNIIIRNTRNTYFAERFLWNAVQRPYPMIEIKYIVPAQFSDTGHDLVVYSTMEFMSVDKNAEKINTWEGDWVNIDQAEQVMDLDEAIQNLGTRVRGTVPATGREKLGRLSLTANSAINPQLWWFADLYKVYPETNLTKRVKTKENKNVTAKQYAAFERRMGGDPKRMAVALDAEEPMPAGKEFGESMIAGCLDDSLDQIFTLGMKTAAMGFEKAEADRAGIVLWKLPADKGRDYVVIGDPGQGSAPARNAPVVMVFDVTDYPKSPMSLRAFWWGNGGGKYSPWINKMVEWMVYYNAHHGAYDATGGQKVHSEVSFADRHNIIPIDTSGIKKRMFLVTLKRIMESKLLKYPPMIRGLTYQLMQYVLPDEAIPQDLVAALTILAGWCWYSGMENPGGEPEDTDVDPMEDVLLDRHGRPLGDRYERALTLVRH